MSAELAADLAERSSGGASEKDKYEKLYARDREMTEFIDRFPEAQVWREGRAPLLGFITDVAAGWFVSGLGC